MKLAVIYARVSSEGDRQNTDHQVADLQSYAAGAGFDVIRTFTEQVSGARDDRPVLTGCLVWCCEGNADVLLVSGLSQLGGTVSAIAGAVGRLTGAGVNIHFADINVDTFLPNGTANVYATQLIAMLELGGRMERQRLMGRLNGGRRRAMESGVVMGRKPGSVKPREQKEAEYSKVIQHLKNGVSIRNTAKLCGVSPKTVQMVKKEFLAREAGCRVGLEMTIGNTPLPGVTKRILVRAGIRTVGDLVGCSPDELGKLKGLGPKRLAEITEYVRSFEYHLKIK